MGWIVYTALMIVGVLVFLVGLYRDRRGLKKYMPFIFIGLVLFSLGLAYIIIGYTFNHAEAVSEEREQTLQQLQEELDKSVNNYEGMLVTLIAEELEAGKYHITVTKCKGSNLILFSSI